MTGAGPSRALVACGAASVVLAVVCGLLLRRCGQTSDDWVRRGDEHLRANRLADAELAYGRALDADPRNVRAIYGKGWALLESGYEDLRSPARQLFQRAIDYDPDWYGGYRGMGALLMEEGKVPAAERHLRMAWDRARDEPTVLESLGQLYLHAGRLDEAGSVFEEALRVAPERGEIRRFLADVALRRGDHEGALAQIERGRQGSVSGPRGQCLLDEGEALVRLDRALRLVRQAGGPEDPRLDEALQEIDRADSVLSEASDRGFQREVLELRQGVLEPLRIRLAEKRAGERSRSTPSIVGH